MTTSKKTCFKCQKLKEINDFYRHAQMGDGRLNKCKECTKKDVRENRAANVDYYREYDRNRASTPHRVQARAEYQKTDAGKEAIKRANKKYLEAYPNKRNAHTAVGNAVRDGRLLKPSSCGECGVSNCTIYGHHDDYSKPLEVRWLCSTCHTAWHKEHGEAKNAA